MTTLHACLIDQPIHCLVRCFAQHSVVHIVSTIKCLNDVVNEFIHLSDIVRFHATLFRIQGVILALFVDAATVRVAKIQLTKDTRYSLWTLQL